MQSDTAWWSGANAPPAACGGLGFFSLDGATMADGGAKPRSGAFAPYKPVERLFINYQRLQCHDAPGFVRRS